MKRITAPAWDRNDLSGARLARYCRASHDEDDREKSVDDQDELGARWGERNECVLIGPAYVDNDISASQYGTKPRPDFDRLLADIEANKIDLIWFWDLSRSTRRLGIYVKLRDLCQRHGVGWVLDGRVFDLTDPMDLQALGYDAVNAEIFSIKLSKNIVRGQNSSAARGRPHGKLNYGYRRVYDGRGRYVEQVPDDALREAIDEKGESYWYSPAGVVREIFERIASGEGQGTIGFSLERRGIPSPRGARDGWARWAIRQLAVCVAYIGKRERNGQVLDHEAPCWPSLLHEDQEKAEELFYAVQRIMSDPARRTSRTSKARHLASWIARCGACGSPLSAQREEVKVYVCNGRSRCVSIRREVLDEFVAEAVILYLSREDVHESLMASQHGDAAVISARAEANRLRGELEDWLSMSESGEADAIAANRAIKGLREKIAVEERRAEAASIPPILRGRTGANARAAWEAIDDVTIKREIVRTCAGIQVNPVGKNAKGAKAVTVDGRLTWRWLLGPEQQEAHGMTLAEPIPRSAPEFDAIAIEQAREIFAEELAAGVLPKLKHITERINVGWKRTHVVHAALAETLGVEVKPRGRRIVSDDFLREVAEVYRAADGSLPALMERYGRTRKCVRLYVARAREGGYLTD